MNEFFLLAFLQEPQINAQPLTAQDKVILLDYIRIIEGSILIKVLINFTLKLFHSFHHSLSGCPRKDKLSSECKFRCHFNFPVPTKLYKLSFLALAQY